jgi:two-component sensor histidine kinase/PAS domain-containing protein
VSTEQEKTQSLETLALYDIMDTPPEQEFDDIVFLASEICHTPVSLVSLVEKDRQWFKARVGFEACETPISQSVCAHALGDTDLLIIPDLTLDPRTSSNTLVTQPPNIRFYAGAPLQLGNGAIVGTLCVIDDKPRPQGLTEAQKKALESLARQVVVLLEMRRISHRKDDLFRRQKQISSVLRSFAHSSITAQEAGSIGTFELDIDTGVMSVTAEFCRVFHVPVADSYPSSLFESLIIDEDRVIASKASDRAEGSSQRNVEYRINTPDSGIRWIARNATFGSERDGRYTKMFGAVRDITDEKLAAARVRALVDLGDKLREFEDVGSMAFQSAELMARALGATRAGFGTVNPVEETVVMQPDWRAPGVSTLAGLHHFRDYGSFIDDLKSGTTVLIADVTTDPRTRDHAQSLIDIGIRVLINVPIFDKGNFDLVVFAHYDQPHEWTADEIDFVRSFGDRLQTAIGRARAEAEQDLLNRELSHRLKNSFAMVQAIAGQTLKSVRPRDPVIALEKRLRALSDAHDILLQQNWTGAPVRDIVADAMVRVGMTDRTDISGPNLSLGAKATLSMTLVLHELATNALKYGAFSNDTGRVSATWWTSGSGEQTLFHFTWQEAGGPAIEEPTQKGFGSKLIQMGLDGTGNVVTRFNTLGLGIEMTAPLTHLQQESQ